MSDLDYFESFICVAQANSLSQAAIQLGITKATLSKQIKQLETQLKIDLFSRADYRLSLTPDGQVLLNQCLRLKRELDDTRSIYQKFHEEPEGDLKIVAFGYFARKLLFPRLKAFLSRYPKLRITIDTSEGVPHLEQEKIDLALGFSLPAPNQEEIIQCSMGTTRYILCASADYFKDRKKPCELNELEKHLYISHTSRTAHLKLRPGYKLQLQPYLLLNSVESMINCAQLGLGLIQLPVYMVQKQLQTGELI